MKAEIKRGKVELSVPEVDGKVATDAEADVVVVDERVVLHQVRPQSVHLETEVFDRLAVLQHRQTTVFTAQILLLLQSMNIKGVRIWKIQSNKKVSTSEILRKHQYKREKR